MSVVTPFKGEEPASMRLATPMAMLDRAIEQGAGIEILTSLMDLVERKEKALNRQAFDQAIAAAKAEIPVVIKNRTSHNGKYADFAQYARTLDPILPKFGLSYRFRTTQTDRILVTCILSHRDGHFEENSLSGPTDTSGSKTAIQSIGSTQSYLMRYSLIAALGLASSDDDDGNGATPPNQLILDAQADRLRDLIEETGSDPAKLCAFFKIGDIADLTQGEFAKAVKMLEAKRARA
jgi:ERF superfamily